MDYFWIRQDNQCPYSPNMEGFYQTMQRKDFSVENAIKIPQRNIMYCNTQNKLMFIDVLDQQLFLISKEVKKVFHMYEKEISYKMFCILNNITGDYGVYYAPIIPAINCLENKTLRNEDCIKIEYDKIGSSSIFRVENQWKEMVVIRLDVAESLLRRQLKGIDLKRVTLC